MPKKLQEENAELHQQVSTLSQWIDKHQQQIDTLEKQLEATENEKDSVLAELYGKENCEQENLQLRKELREVEVEVNRLKRQAHTERQEEMKMKVQTQTQVIELLSEHNNALERQVRYFMQLSCDQLVIYHMINSLES